MKLMCQAYSIVTRAKPSQLFVGHHPPGFLSSLAVRSILGLFAAPLMLAALGQEVGGKAVSAAASPQNGRYTTRLQSIVNRAAGRELGGGALMVLPSGGDPKAQAELREDLVVMHHLLEKAVAESLGAEERYRKALGVNLVFSPDSSQLREAYIEGYGAMFLFRVGFPLLPAASQTESPKQDRETNSAWEEARQEVFGESPAPGNGVVAFAEPYSEEKVNHLKATMLNALKNAANIRGLKRDEGVTICIFGAPKNAAVLGSSATGGDLARLSGTLGSAAVQKSTMMTIRAKGGDIDAFSKGQMSSEEFRKNASIAIYESEGAGEGGVYIGGSGDGVGWMYGRGRY